MNETFKQQETAQPQPVTNQAPPPPQTTQQEPPPVSITEKKKKPVLPIVLSILLVLSLGAAGYFAYMYYQPQIPGITSTETTETTPSSTPSPTPNSISNTQSLESTNPNSGTISGKLCYPSSHVPEGAIVAKDITTQQTYRQEYPGTNVEPDVSYTMTLPTSTYILKFTTENGANGYYTQCGKNFECQDDLSHSLIEFSVEKDSPLSNINPCDFYYDTNNEPVF